MFDSEILKLKNDISFLPTPLHKLNNLSKVYNMNLYIKRDDMTGLAMGGNKSRKLDYLIKDALDKNSEIVITMGAIQSNHCRQTAAACKRFGLECILILEGKEEYSYSGNLLLDYILGAKIYFVNSTNHANQVLENLLKENSCKRTYFIPAGGSNAIGAQGYINTYREILEDEKKLNIKFDYIFLATSSLGTQSGLIIGQNIYGGRSKIIGINITKNFFDISGKQEKRRILDIILEFEKKFNLNLNVNEESIIVDDRFCVNGYGIMTKEEIECIDMFAKNEGILLDPVYTSRAAAGMIKYINNKEITEGSNILFLHTGGYPSIFSSNMKTKF